MYNNTETRIANILKKKIEKKLSGIGLLCRVFARAKTIEALNIKINKDPEKYQPNGKLIQDLYGVRVALYFPDDNEIAQEAIKILFSYDCNSSTIDKPDSNSFSATRCNLIFKLPEELIRDSSILASNNLIDKTFEVQLRTILSEGWHEVDHDLRYKCLGDWSDSDDLSRALNGIYASLETSDWGMMKLFDELSYRHYKKKEWSAMIRNKFRLRLDSNAPLSSEICKIFDENENVAKEIFRVDRDKFLYSALSNHLQFPIILDNIVYISNLLYVHCKELVEITPSLIKDEVNESNLPSHLNLLKN